VILEPIVQCAGGKRFWSFVMKLQRDLSGLAR
jgi:hypothetical protein